MEAIKAPELFRLEDGLKREDVVDVVGKGIEAPELFRLEDGLKLDGERKDTEGKECS